MGYRDSGMNWVTTLVAEKVGAKARTFTRVCGNYVHPDS